MIYIILFIISLSFIFTGSKIKNKVFSFVFIFTGLMIPCLIAGLRSINVGTDQKIYIKSMYDLAEGQDSFNNYLKIIYLWHHNKDYLYLFLTFLCSKFNNGYQLLLFLIEFLIIIPIYLASYKYFGSKKIATISIAIYYLTFFNLSLNVAIQSIAIAFFILSFVLFIKKKRRRDLIFSIVLFIFSIGFHSTALITIFIYIIYMILNSKIANLKKIRADFIFFINILLITILLFCKPVLLYIGNAGIFPHALNYLNMSKDSTVELNESSLIVNMFLLFLIIYYKKRIILNNENYDFILELCIINLFVNLLETFIKHAGRLAYYSYYLLLLIYIPSLYINRRKKIEILDIFITLLIIMFFVYIIYFNLNQTLPYELWNRTNE